MEEVGGGGRRREEVRGGGRRCVCRHTNTHAYMHNRDINVSALGSNSGSGKQVRWRGGGI
eukprot:1439476-Rhodomonas_salina.2